MAKDDYSDDSFIVSDNDSGDDVKSTKKGKKRPAAKEKGKATKKPAKEKFKAPPVPEVTTTYPDGWTIHPPSLIYKRNMDAKGSTKIAGFDLDGTLIDTKSGAAFANSPDDWQFFNPTVPAKLKEYYDQGYQIVIFSNQGGIKGALTGKASLNLREKVDNMINTIRNTVGDLQPHFICATQKDEYRKPDKGMWQLYCNEMNGGVAVDLKASFYCGDAAGRAASKESDADFANSDAEFAAAIGVGSFKTPEEMFGEKTGPPKCMVPENEALMDAFNELADLLKARGVEHFKCNVWKKVATAILNYDQKITSGKQVKSLKGIGKASITKIDEFLSTGTFEAITELKATANAPVVLDAHAQDAMKFVNF